MSDKYPGISPFAYCLNNPIKFIDPNGMEADWVEGVDKTVHWDPAVTSAGDKDLKSGERYIGKTVNGMDSKGNFVYGDQNGKTWPSAPLKDAEIKPPAIPGQTSSINPSDFPGVQIRTNIIAKFTDRGWYSDGIIHLPPNVRKSYVQHEYGHFLQELRFSKSEYHSIQKASFLNATGNIFRIGPEHNTFWTERDANRRASMFFGPNQPISTSNWPK